MILVTCVHLHYMCHQGLTVSKTLRTDVTLKVGLLVLGFYMIYQLVLIISDILAAMAFKPREPLDWRLVCSHRKAWRSLDWTILLEYTRVALLLLDARATLLLLDTRTILLLLDTRTTLLLYLGNWSKLLLLHLINLSILLLLLTRPCRLNNRSWLCFTLG